MHLLASFDWTSVALLPVVFLLVVINGFFVAAEFAFVCIRKTQVDKMLQEKRLGAESVQRLVESLNRTISTTQLGITITSLLLGWIGEKSIANLLFPVFEFLGAGWSQAISHTIAATLAILIVTFLHVILGEVVPKAMAIEKPEAVSLYVAGPLVVFAKLTRPLIAMINFIGLRVLRWIGLGKLEEGHQLHSVEELSLIVGQVEAAGLLSEEQAKYVQNVFRLSQKTVSECMLPKDKMVSLELRTPVTEALEKAREERHTRLPVYDKAPDKIIGIINTKDLLFLTQLGQAAVLYDATYDADFVKPDESIGEVMKKLRQRKRHMAIVRNNEQQVLGLITLEDILEEIVGDLEDEHDDPNKNDWWRKRRMPWIGKSGPTVGKSGKLGRLG